MTALIGLAWLWWGLIGLAGFLLGVWGVYQLWADDKYLSDLKSGKANLKHRDAWLRQHFGETGRKLWLANEARRRTNRYDQARRVPGGYEGTVNDWGRDLAEYSYNPPWGMDLNRDYTPHHSWEVQDWMGHLFNKAELFTTHKEPRACDWLSAGFWAPFVIDGRHIDPIQMVEDEMVVGFQTSPQKSRGYPQSPFDDNNAVVNRARARAMRIEGNGGLRARGIGLPGYENRGKRRSYWGDPKNMVAV